MKSLYRRLPAALVDLELGDGIVGGERVHKGEDEEEFSSAPKREFSKNVELSGTVRLNAAASSTSVLSCPLKPPPLHAAPPCPTISPVHSLRERRQKKRRENFQQPEEIKEKLRGAVILFCRADGVFRLPEWLKFSLFHNMIFCSLKNR